MPHNSFPLDLNALFSELETTPSNLGWQGTAERRIPSNSPCDLFAGIQKPVNLRVFRARFKVSALPDSYSLPAFQGLELSEWRDTDGGAERLTVSLHAPTPAYNEVFTSLADDIARYVGEQDSEQAAAEAFLRRLHQWQRLLQRQGWRGLTPEAQRGLYGELRFLNDLVLPICPLADGVTYWTGPTAAAKDFQFPGNWAVEVKTTAAKQPQMLMISSERQLDDSGLAGLYLAHYSVESHHSGGETLPIIIQQVREILAADGTAQALFEDKLFEAGYFNAHASQYENIGYIWRGTNIYQVSYGFPRIVEASLIAGVGNVHYAISAAACKPFSVSLDNIKERIRHL